MARQAGAWFASARRGWPWLGTVGSAKAGRGKVWLGAVSFGMVLLFVRPAGARAPGKPQTVPDDAFAPVALSAGPRTLIWPGADRTVVPIRLESPTPTVSVHRLP